MLQIKNTLGGGKPNAPYAWAKYNTIENPIYYINPSFTAKVITAGSVFEIVTSSFDASKVDTSFFEGFKFDVNTVNLSVYKENEKYYISKGGNLSSPREFTYDPTTMRFNINNLSDSIGTKLPLNGGNYTGNKPTGEYEIVVDSLIEYIIDDSPNKYPNGEVHTDGFFYRYAPEGLYAWKKYEAVTIPAAHITFENSAWSRDTTNDYMYKAMNSTDVDVSILKKEDFDGATGTTRYGPPDTVSISNGIITYTNSNTTKKCEFKVENGIFYQKGSDTYDHAHYGALTLDIVEHTRMGDFIDYIVSDKETAYPDGGEKGGYWYEKVSDLNLSSIGCTKYEMGSITPSSNTVNVTVTHSMGIKPKYGIMVREAEASSGYTISKVATMVFEDAYCGAYAFFSGGQKDENYNGTTFNMSIDYFSDTKFTFSGSGSYKFFSGFKYNYILLG